MHETPVHPPAAGEKPKKFMATGSQEVWLWRNSATLWLHGKSALRREAGNRWKHFLSLYMS